MAGWLLGVGQVEVWRTVLASKGARLCDHLGHQHCRGQHKVQACYSLNPPSVFATFVLRLNVLNSRKKDSGTLGRCPRATRPGCGSANRNFTQPEAPRFTCKPRISRGTRPRTRRNVRCSHASSSSRTCRFNSAGHHQAAQQDSRGTGIRRNISSHKNHAHLISSEFPTPFSKQQW